MVAERAFVAQRLARVNVAFDDEVGVGQNGFQFGQNVFRAAANSAKTNVESRAILRQTTSMATLSLTDEQVVELVKQLPPQSKQRVLTDLTAERDQWWQTAAREGEIDMGRLAAARGLDWDVMTEAQREAFVDDLLHES